MRLCSLEGCGKKHYGHGWCHMHLVRWQKHGDTSIVKKPEHPGPKPKALAERFWSKVSLNEGGCWLWLGSRDRLGYGSFRIDRKTRAAHCVAYEQMVGPIPAKHDLHHVCADPSCVNPSHLIPMTRKEHKQIHRESLCSPTFFN